MSSWELGPHANWSYHPALRVIIVHGLVYDVVFEFHVVVVGLDCSGAVTIFRLGRIN